MSQIKNKFIEAASGSTVSGVTDVNIRLRNAQPLRARNAANSADISILAVNASDVITMGGPLSMGSNKITNITNPTAGSQEAATANYVDAAIVAAAGANKALSNLNTTSINQSLIPTSDAILDLGSTVKRWANSYLTSIRDNSGNKAFDTVARSLLDDNGDVSLFFNNAGEILLNDGVKLSLTNGGTISILAGSSTVNYSISLPAAQGASNTYLKNDGSGNLSWASAGTGTVTSVALAAPAIFTVSGSPVTSSGTLTLSYSGTALPIANGGTNSTTALNNNRVMISSGSAIVENAAITANRALASDSAGIPVASAVTNTELGYVGGVTSSIQTQLNGKLSLTGGTMSGAIAMGTNKITGMGDPTAAQDAATKAYVDAVAQGLKPKAAVRVATTTAGTLASSFENGDTIDGVVLATGNRILIKDQVSQAENGIYTVNASGAPTRATDFDSVTPIDEINGAYTLVQFGTANAGTGWVETATVVTVGTDPIVFQQFTAASSVIGGDMITVSGATISVDLASVSGLESTNPGNPAGQLRAKVNVATVKINGSNELEGLKPTSENLTLNSTDITNQYKDLSFAVYGTSTSVNSVVLSVVGGPVQQKTVDYTVSLTGGSGGVTRITFAGDLATGGAAALISGDILMVSYSYLT